MYGMNPKGVCELRDLGKLEQRSADGEDFSTALSELHEHVKQRLQYNTCKYKQKDVLKRREVNFEVDDLVLAHLRKERFPRGEYNMIKLKKIGPCKILIKFSTNVYELELPTGIGISLIFKVANLYPYQDDDKDQSLENIDDDEIDEAKWLKQMPMANPLEPGMILDIKIARRMRGKKYYEYLVKWKDRPKEDSTWMSATYIHKSGHSIEYLMRRSS